MASSSIQCSSSALITWTTKYDVFISFRGKDTRLNFTDHLFGALRREGIIAFRDDKNLKKGESIAPELLHAIEGSQVFAVVLSKNYASSKWCLRELEKILECVRASEKRVLPIFYDVDPSYVRKQKGSYAKAFAKHEKRFKQDLEMVRRWREALTQVADLSGWDVRGKPQYAEIGKIVEEITNILRHKFSSSPNDLVGMHSPTAELEKLLRLGSVDDVQVVGISGMGGIGKTTLAKFLYGRISRQFDARCFIDDLSKIYRHDGPIGAQRQILCQTLGEDNLQIWNHYNGANLVQSGLHRLRALIILDNVDRVEQLEELAVNREWLGAGSRVIIISRDEHILKEHGVDVVYKVPLLSWTDSCQLFCRKAFKCDNIMSNYEQLTCEILDYVDHLPLAVKVLGSFLYGRDTAEWRSALVRLRESPNKRVMNVLRLSFDGLEEMEKEIFLDIACFFNCYEEKYVKNVLNCCGLHPDIGLRVLIDKSLITFDEDEYTGERWIAMHSLLRELGNIIVQENSTSKPRNWTRLWHYKHFHNVVLENMEKNVEAIVLKRETEILMAEALSKMSRLRLLILWNVNVLESPNCLSNELRYVAWYGYPFTYLPSNFEPNQLVELILEHSNIKQLWEDRKYLPSLRALVLSYSENLIKMPDFREIPNLERLDLEGCEKLGEIDQSIGVLRKLVFLNLKYCKNLISIPINIFSLPSLKCLNLSGCSKVYKSSVFHGDLLPSLPSFSCLRELDASFCSLRDIPDAIGCMCWLEKLNLRGNKFVRLPSLRDLSNLVYLNLEYCVQLKCLPELPLPAALRQDHHLLSDTENYLEATLYIVNCPELSEKECYSSMALSWMIQFIQANPESSASLGRIVIVIPGSEVPMWFNNQSQGRKIRTYPSTILKIRIDPSPILHDNNFIGIACCVVFSVAPSRYGPYSNYASLVISFRTEFSVLSADTKIKISLARVLITAESNNMCLIYLPRDSFFSRFLRINDSIKLRDLGDIYIDLTLDEGGRLDLKVKNCGYSWVFKENIQQLARKRKFLAIEDTA